MAILSKYISLFLCLAIISILCACNLFEEEVYLKPMPVFASVDEAGAKVSDEQLHQGYTVIFLPCQDEYVNNGIAGRIEEFARIEKLEFNKLAVKDEKSRFSGEAWRKVVDNDLRRKLEGRYPTAFALIFEDNKFLGGLTTDPEPKLNVNLDYVRQNLYELILKINSSEALFQYHKPENYIDASQLLLEISEDENIKGTHYILIVGAATSYCEDKNIIKYFENIMLDFDDVSYEIVLAPNFNEVDRGNLVNNFKLDSELKLFPEKLLSGMQALNQSNYSLQANTVFVYKSGVFQETFIINSCESIHQLY